MYQTRPIVSSIPMAGNMAAPPFHYEEYGMYNPYGIGANVGYPVPPEVYINGGTGIPWTNEPAWGIPNGVQQFDLVEEDGNVYENSMGDNNINDLIGYSEETVITEDGQILTLSAYAALAPESKAGFGNTNSVKNGPIEKDLSLQSLYKTELCRSYEETGCCRYGSKCQFAHGEEELRPVLRHPKYKTQVCKAFHSTGTCHYGSRCRFIHIRPDEPLPDEEYHEDEEEEKHDSSPHTPSNSPPPAPSPLMDSEVGSPAKSRLAIFRSFTTL